MKPHLSEYCFCLHTCRLGNRIRKSKNPFTGKTIDIPIDDGVTAMEWSAIQRVFDEYAVKGPEPEGEGYAMYLPEDGSIRFRGGPDIKEAEPKPFTIFPLKS